LKDAHRSGCPINLSLEELGDRWGLIVIRDIIFGNRCRYRELLSRSEEGIASLHLGEPSTGPSVLGERGICYWPERNMASSEAMASTITAAP
jgi:hypothetical protein